MKDIIQELFINWINDSGKGFSGVFSAISIIIFGNRVAEYTSNFK